MPASQLVSAQHGIIARSNTADGDTAGLPDRYSCAPLYGAYGPWGGRALLGSVFLHLGTKLLLH